jgi:hypothetical protein
MGKNTGEEVPQEYKGKVREKPGRSAEKMCEDKIGGRRSGVPDEIAT